MQRISFKIINKKKELVQLRNKIKLISLETKPFNKKLFLEKFWDWQYKKLPSRISYVFGAYNNGKIIGYIHVPIYNYFFNNKLTLSACIQEVAIDKDYRKQKIFYHFLEYCLKYLKKKKIKFIYSFPNKKSIKTFLNLKFKKALQYKLSFALVFLFKKPKQDVFISNKFKKEFNFCNTIFLKRHSSGILRNEKYFKWRYDTSPKANYYYIYTKTKKQVTAFIVVRKFNFFGLNFLILMDLAFNDEIKLINLIKSIKKIESFKKINFIIFTCKFNRYNKLSKFIKLIDIPNFFNFRKINYMTKNLGKKFNLRRNFLVSLSDWDVL